MHSVTTGERRSLLTSGPWYHLALAVVAVQFELAHASVGLGFLDLPRYLALEGPAPYQYRVLPALLARPLVGLLRALGVDAWLASRPPPFQSPEAVALIAVNLAALVALGLLARWHLTRLLGSRRLGALTSLGLFLVLPFNLVLYHQARYWLPYDLPSVAGFYALFLLATRARWAGFYLLFPLAVLNRETVVFVSVIALLAGWRASPRRALAHFVAQVALWCAVKAALHALVRPTGGPPFELHLGLNLRYLANPMWWPQLLACFGFLWVPVWVGRRLLTDPALRAGTSAFLLYLPLMLVVGQLVEVRIFAEFLPIYYAGAALVARHAAARASASLAPPVW